jgi:hypothetical protein
VFGELQADKTLATRVLRRLWPSRVAEVTKVCGMRFRAECRLAGKPFGDPFGVDVVFGEPIVDTPDVITADDVLGFAGIAPPTVRLYSVETHLAEKVHAYTLPRTRPNSRVKDLPDIALLAGAKVLEASQLRAAFEQTFTFRKTHDLPASLPLPSATWERPYAAMARSDDLPWPTLTDVTAVAKSFVDPILARSASGTWDQAEWRWV